ncbi:outer membrane protein assembly factor BamE [Kordiimonas sp. SCSIO 12610]|uniref:outer membrane protein assembly factor BamE n=1 Tax=Kordiimonas sp. SCSIO 12610 TaxID=2829597 RepID=UPI00210A0B62|nr:outer membrane protein assembly factor BamE [Kordiimonas sp. SCSIO 12610]UTW54115.1 outer membrane protein assembly factor BamE [Kordiimonas sp. SCSIO 12610]
MVDKISNMKPYSKIGKMTIVLALGISISACSNSRSIRGYVFDAELADAITAGIDNRQSVESTLGTPTVRGTFSNDVWYYVSTTVKVRPVFWPEAKEHRVLAVGFNESGIVEKIENFDLSDMQVINPVGGKTKTRGTNIGFFQQIFGSLGRFGGQAPVGAPQGGNGPNGS